MRMTALRRPSQCSDDQICMRAITESGHHGCWRGGSQGPAFARSTGLGRETKRRARLAVGKSPGERHQSCGDAEMREDMVWCKRKMYDIELTWPARRAARANSRGANRREDRSSEHGVESEI